MSSHHSLSSTAFIINTAESGLLGEGVINRGETLGEHKGCAARVGATVIGRSGSFRFGFAAAIRGSFQRVKLPR
jgi:hypothetical protein